MTSAYTAGFTHYDERRDPVDHVLDKVLPADPELCHAVIYNNRTHEPVFLESWGYATALCGRRVKVVLPVDFDPGDPDACQRCAGAALRGDMPPSSYDDALWDLPHPELFDDEADEEQGA